MTDTIVADRKTGTQSDLDGELTGIARSYRIDAALGDHITSNQWCEPLDCALDERRLFVPSRSTATSDRLRADVSAHTAAIDALSGVIATLAPGEERVRLTALLAEHTFARTETQLALHAVETDGDPSLPLPLGITTELLRDDVEVHSAAIEVISNMIGVMPAGDERRRLAALTAQHSAARTETKRALHAVAAEHTRLRRAACSAPRARLPMRRVCARGRASRRSATVARAAARATADPDGDGEPARRRIPASIGGPS